MNRIKTTVIALALTTLATACQADAELDQSEPRRKGKLPGGKFDSADAADEGGLFVSNYFRHERGAKLHPKGTILSEALVSNDTSHPDELFEAVKTALGVSIITLSGEDIELVYVEKELAADGYLYHVTMRQTVDGVPIIGTQIKPTFRTGYSGGAELVSTSFNVYQSPELDTIPTISTSDAITKAREAARVDANAPVYSTALRILEAQGRLHLVYDVIFSNSPHKTYVIANGAHQGRVLGDDTTLHLTGEVRGRISTNGYNVKGERTQWVPLPWIEISGGEGAVTNGDGQFELGISPGAPITASLTGPIADVRTATGFNSNHTRPFEVTVTAGEEPIELLFEAAGSELDIAMTTAYYSIARTRKFLEENGFSPEEFGDPVTVTVNTSNPCESMYLPMHRSLVFARSGDKGSLTNLDLHTTLSDLTTPPCNNTARPSIVIHEYGHFLDDHYGGITDPGLAEGWGDALACLVLDDPLIGHGMHRVTDTTGLHLPFIPAPSEVRHVGALRTCDNTYKYPGNGIDHAHNLAQAWSGFVWHARQELIAKHGEERGDQIARDLILPSLRSNAADIPAAVMEVFIRDDDDGDMRTESPNYDALLRAAELHDLHDAVEIDDIPPAQITDLRVFNSRGVWFWLEWTAPGDDGFEGQAKFYRLVASTAPINEDNFDFAVEIDNVPKPPADGYFFPLSEFANHQGDIFFAMVSYDNQLNRSPVSNVAVARMNGALKVFEQGAEPRTGVKNIGEIEFSDITRWGLKGLWHVTDEASATGDHAFWFGKEDTVNFDTNGAISGSLTSPEIDLSGLDHPLLTINHFGDFEEGANFDAASVVVAASDGSHVQVFQSEELFPSFTAGFTKVGIDLAAFKNKKVTIEFVFNTGDDKSNESVGWIIDDIIIFDMGSNPNGEQLIINEILSWPGSTFDANRDGIISPSADEYVEIVNPSQEPVDLGGATLHDSIRDRFTFPQDFILGAGEAVVVFGGGAPQLDGAHVFTAPNGLDLDDLGDRVLLRSGGGRMLAQASYTVHTPDASMTRARDGEHSAAWTTHDKLGEFFGSPGTRSDGRPFVDRSSAPPLVINEIHANTRADDVNGDGRENLRDQYIELFNPTAESIDLSDVIFVEDGLVRGQFPNGARIEQGEYLVIMGFEPSQVAFRAISVNSFEFGGLALGLNGGTIELTRPNGDVVASASYGPEAQDRFAITRLIDGDPTSRFVRHDHLDGQPLSPGRAHQGMFLRD